MKLKNAIISAAISLLPTIATAQPQMAYNDFKTVETEIKSSHFDFNRKIIIGLPPNYDQMTA